MKIHADFRLFASANFDATRYIPSPAYGVNRFMLDRIGNELARATTIVQYQPNSKFPKHSHIGGEEFIVLQGTFHDQYGSFPTGSYVRNPIGTEHEPWVEEDGCTIMVKLLQMADPAPAESKTPIHIRLDQAKSDMGQVVDCGTVAQVYANDHTGEIVEMVWINPRALLPADAKCVGGEELFVISGSLKLDDDSYGKKDTYEKWGWLRFPPKAQGENWTERQSLMAGDSGALLYRKTGHLTEKARAMEKIQILDDEKTTPPE